MPLKGAQMKLIIPILIMTVAAMAGSIDHRLVAEMAGATDTDLIPVFILAHGQVDRGWVEAATVGMNRADRQQFAVEALKAVAQTAQQDIISSLENGNSHGVANIQPLWLANAVYCEATPAVIREMAARADVWYVESAAREGAGLIEPVDVRPVNPDERSRALAWGVAKINADDAWALGYEGQGVIVGVIDTGVDYNHGDLHNNMWHDTAAGYHYGWNFYEGNSNPMDTHGHGTHCAGSVAGYGTAGTETGVAPSATIMALRINYFSGGEYTWIQAMEFGADNGAAVLSMSLGSGQGNTTLRTAEANLLTAGVFHSVAAGNSGSGASTVLSSGDSPPPWFHPNQTHHGGQTAVVTVGATNSSDGIASFSSRGPTIVWSDYPTSGPLIDPDISGPGVDVVSTSLGGGYESMSGTSMATPHIAGVAALILSANPSLTVAQVDSLMEVTSLDLGTAGKDNTYGAGRVDAYQAVLAALSMVGAEEQNHGAIGPVFVGISPVSPNPVSSFAAFTVNAAVSGPADIAVFDVSGRRTANIATEDLTAGAHAFSWQVPDNLGTGVYFVRATLNGQSVSSRMTLIR
jgi:subtilisin family serine protease